jgi:hypothetical protein
MRQAGIFAATTAGLIICFAGAANAFERGPQWSDDNLRHIRTNLEWIVDSLQNDRRDYNGHRVAAIGDSQQAREAITDAIAYDNSQENVPNPNFNTQISSGLRSGQGSDANLVRMRQVLERDIDMLQHDQEDYNGNRVRAINYMQQTRTEIIAALQADQGH